MTRAKERLIVSGSIDREKPARRVDADRLGARPARRPTRSSRRTGTGRSRSSAATRGSSSASTGTARTTGSRRAGAEPRRRRRRPAQLALFAAPEDVAAAPPAPELPALAPPPEPPLHRVRRLSFTALSTLRAVLVQVLRDPRRRHVGAARRRRGATARAGCARPRSATRCTGCSSRSTSRAGGAGRRAGARLVPGRRPTRSSSGSAASSRRTATPSWRRGSPRSPRVEKERHFTFEHDGVLLHGYPRRAAPRRGRARSSLDYKTNLLGERVAGGDRRGRLPAAAARLRARVLPRRRGGGRGRLPLPRAAGRGRRDDVRARRRCRSSRRSSRRRSRASTRASSGRRRASSPAPAAPRSTSSAPARGCTAAATRPVRRSPPSASVASCRGATSRGAEARRAEARADPADHRAARRRARRRGDRAPVPQPARAARLGDALRADDRRERQPRHGDAVPEVPDAGGLPRRAAGGARARHLRDRLLPAEGEVAARDDAHAARGVRRRGAAHARRARAAAGRRAQDGERRLGRARPRAGDRRRHARAPALAAARADEAGGSGEDRARPREARPARRLGAGSRTC